MKLIPSRPVTIHATRKGERWFPFMFRQANIKGSGYFFSPLVYPTKNQNKGRPLRTALVTLLVSILLLRHSKNMF